jgi:hypothetical protein
MSRQERLISNSLTICADVSELTYECVEAEQGLAKLIRFRLVGDQPRFGDTLLVVSGAEILFHGLVRALVSDGYALAMDPGSRLPHQRD